MGVDLFLKLSKNAAPIKGECDDQNFVGMSQLQSFEMAALSLLSRPETKPGGPPGADEWEEPAADACSFNVKKALDSASPDLFLNYTEAQSPERRSSCLLRATVYFRLDGAPLKAAAADNVSFLVLDFMDVFVYSYSLNCEDDAVRPTEDVKFYFDKYKLTYRDLDTSKGVFLKAPARVGWDFASNQAL